ncbi:hypothetical protein RSOLAG22IIIB_12709 [Rhizoctonia solani]|uniref:Uncharacterized protein n=1 Tax=Rhizoctonia solani TaxID=456999 RepID=A0A0K6GFJ5_9AGAM|nr:hypothetical protein RSOLAG22IIIB_12709 [Rhizoctonia solani]
MKGWGQGGQGGRGRSIWVPTANLKPNAAKSTASKPVPTESTAAKADGRAPTKFKPTRPLKNLKLNFNLNVPEVKSLSGSSKASKRSGQNLPAGQLAPKKQKKAPHKTVNLRAAAAAKEGKKQKKPAKDSPLSGNPLPAPEAPTAAAWKRPKMRPVPPPEESTLTSTASKAAPPATTRAAKASKGTT